MRFRGSSPCIWDWVTSMKEEKLSLVLATLSFRWSFCHDIIEELLSEFNIYSENRVVILSFKNSSCRCRVSVPEGTVAEKVEDILSGSETNSALQKAHRTNTWLCRLSCSWASVPGWYNVTWNFGFDVQDMNNHLYKLKQAQIPWYGVIDSFMTRLGFTKSKFDPNLYFKIENDGPVILLLYVDEFSWQMTKISSHIVRRIFPLNLKWRT